jgi:hypothetical protein
MIRASMESFRRILSRRPLAVWTDSQWQKFLNFGLVKISLELQTMLLIIEDTVMILAPLDSPCSLDESSVN